MVQEADIVVIGGGVGGLMVALGALQIGRSVILIEKNPKLQDYCYSNYIINKSFHQTAKIMHQINVAEKFGLDSYKLPVNLERISEKNKRVIDNKKRVEDFAIFQQLGGAVIFGTPKFIDKNNLIVGNQRVFGKKMVLATGARPVVPKVAGLKETGFLTIDSLHKCENFPEKLIILGASIAGIEIAQTFARLGSEVTLLELTDKLPLPVETEFSWRLRDILEAEGVQILTGIMIDEIYRYNRNKVVDCQNHTKERFIIKGDEIIVTMGVKPNVETLYLENARVNYNANGIVVNKRLQTSERNIFAVGDVVDYQHKSFHATEYQANIVLANTAFRFPSRISYKILPNVIFTDPPLGFVGIPEYELSEKKINKVDIIKFELKNTIRSNIAQQKKGLLKLIVYKGKILGATVLGNNAEEIISQIALVMQMGCSVYDIATTVYPHFTSSQELRYAINQHFGKDLFADKNKKIVNLVHKVLK